MILCCVNGERRMKGGSIMPVTILEEKRVRVIVNTDAKNEVDDQFAIVHALLSPSFRIAGIIPAHFGKEKSLHSMEGRRQRILVKPDDRCRLFHLFSPFRFFIVVR